MSEFYETIAKKNDSLKLVKTFDEFYDEILNYLKGKFKVKDIEIILIDNEERNQQILYKSTNELIDEENIVFELIQSNTTTIKIIIAIDDYEFLKDNRFVINLALQAFSQTLYNRLLKDTLKDISLVDNVTGLYNRHYLDNYADKILSLSSRENKKVAFLKIAVDQFKAVIDEFDYTVGDKVLIALAQILRDSVRSSDIVVKIDSDEFLVILLNVVSSENAMMISEKIIERFSEQQVVVNEKTNQILKKTICSGVSIYPDDATDIDEIIRKSDIALYEARNLGRSKTFKFSQEDTNTIDFF
ncbi:MAG: GGDEF domain-containing protein [Campylobacterota bacterium]